MHVGVGMQNAHVLTAKYEDVRRYSSCIMQKSRAHFQAQLLLIQILGQPT